ncbi:MAG: inosose dehydratase, partial [Microbacteriaceae bacterium]|nr:inosose dehydratase [Microbacteriaceae bacterium]
MTDTTTTPGLRIGTAPDSWGVWFADDPRQTPWQRFLDEVQAAGYTWIELGPYGYLPTDPHRLEDELGARGLKLSAGTVFTGFHKGDDQWQRAWDQALNVAGLASKLGADQLVVIPDLWRSDATAEVLESRTLTDEQWRRLAAGHDRLGKALLDEFGVHQQFHSHADSHVGTYREVVRFLDETDPRYTNLCLDTGHFAYYGGDNLRLIGERPDRIGYLHLKQVDPELLFEVLKNDVPFAEAVPQGIMVEPPQGVPEFAPIIDAVAALDP